jgi:glycosyltransferase involved in cell wall biosynthesis
MKRKITIIICCYNGANRIGKVLEYIYNQKELEIYVYEIIVVDNHSTDNIKDVVYSYEEKNDSAVPLRYVYEDKPGLSNARKKGVDSCKTEWIAFLDDDNLIMQGWINNVCRYIEVNQNVGVLNGAVVPYVPFEMNKEEELRLKASLKVLACTHYDIEEVKNKPKTPFRNPIGAGMVIRTEPLKELSENGWLNSSGRTKDKLTSGEDGEMAFFVKNKGFDFGFCPDAILYHEMNKGRLQDEYLEKMWYEIGRGVAVVAKEQKTKKLKLIAYQALLRFRWIGYAVENPYKGKYYKKYIEGFSHEF